MRHEDGGRGGEMRDPMQGDPQSQEGGESGCQKRPRMKPKNISITSIKLNLRIVVQFTEETNAKNISASIMSYN